MGARRGVHRVLVGKHEGKRPFVCDKLHGTQYTPQLEKLFINITEHLRTYFY
jgi:hypothetical protein